MPVAKVNVGRVIPDNTMRSLDGSQDTSAWALLTTDDITATSDPNGLETSKGMSGREFQFRGGTPSGSSLSNPNDGCLFSIPLKTQRQEHLLTLLLVLSLVLTFISS